LRLSKAKPPSGPAFEARAYSVSGSGKDYCATLWRKQAFRVDMGRLGVDQFCALTPPVSVSRGEYLAIVSLTGKIGTVSQVSVRVWACGHCMCCGYTCLHASQTFAHNASAAQQKSGSQRAYFSRTAPSGDIGSTIEVKRESKGHTYGFCFVLRAPSVAATRVPHTGEFREVQAQPPIRRSSDGRSNGVISIYCGREGKPGEGKVCEHPGGACFKNHWSCCGALSFEEECSSAINSDGVRTFAHFDPVHAHAVVHFCGRNVGTRGYHDPCGGCDGQCGPTNGCQCESCYLLDHPAGTKRCVRLLFVLFNIG
jgi:hypothetical protein